MDIMLLDHVAESASLGRQMPSLESTSLDPRMDISSLVRVKFARDDLDSPWVQSHAGEGR